MITPGKTLLVKSRVVKVKTRRKEQRLEGCDEAYGRGENRFYYKKEEDKNMKKKGEQLNRDQTIP